MAKGRTGGWISVLKSLRPRGFLSARTRQALRFDLLRLRARLLHHTRQTQPKCDQLHLGCGQRRVPGWLNVDVAGSDYDIDLGCGSLPWPDASFSTVVSQQVIEHLDLERELLPLLHELRRVCRPGAELWLACPDMEKVCKAYFDDRGQALLADRQTRWPDFQLDGIPPQHMVNVLFHQSGEHKNLYDAEILDWALRTAGFEPSVRRVEADLLTRFPEFPERRDDFHALYVSCRVGKEDQESSSSS